MGSLTAPGAAGHPGHCAVLVDPAGSRRPSAAAGSGGGGEGAPRDRPVPSHAAVEQIVEVNERICEAPQPGRRRPQCRSAKKGALHRARGSQVRQIARLAAEAARALAATAGWGPPSWLRAGLLKLGGSMLGSCCPPTPASAARGCCAARGMRRSSPTTGTRRLIRSSARSRCAVPGIAARNASMASRRAIPSSCGRHVPSPGLAAIRHRRGHRAVREGGRAAGRPGRGAADRQAGRARGRGQRCGAGRRSPGAIRPVRRPELVPLPPQPLADMLYGAIDGTGVTTTARETAGGRKRRGRAGPHPRGQARCVLHPRRRRRGRLPGAGPRSCSYSPPSSPPPCSAAW